MGSELIDIATYWPMTQFYREYPELNAIGPPPVAQLDDSTNGPPPVASLGDEEQTPPALILYQDRNQVVAEYALRGIAKPIGVSEYELTRALPTELKSSLPTIEQIESELSKEMESES